MAKRSAMQRALMIFRHLQHSAASRQTLMQILLADDPDVYRDLTPKAASRKFERDIDKLRHDLFVDVPYESDSGHYILRDAGPLLSLSFSAESLRALAFLIETTDDNRETRTVIDPLLDDLTRMMGSEQVRQLGNATSELHVDLQQLDDGIIAQGVWEKVRFARNKKRRLRFFYVSPASPSDVPRLHIVEPHELRFRQGHFYLYGYCTEWRELDGLSGGRKWIQYRMDRIQAEGIEVTPGMFTLRSEPRIPIRFKLAPRLWRGGLSRRFDKMEIVEVDEDGWAVISAETPSLFDARRVLLGYGALAIALAPERLVQELSETISQMGLAYPLTQTQQEGTN